MRIKVSIDDELIAEAMTTTGAKTERDVVEKALRTLIRIHRQTNVLDLAGTIDWIGDLNAMRTDDESIPR